MLPDKVKPSAAQPSPPCDVVSTAKLTVAAAESTRQCSVSSSADAPGGTREHVKPVRGEAAQASPLLPVAGGGSAGGGGPAGGGGALGGTGGGGLLGGGTVGG